MKSFKKYYKANEDIIFSISVTREMYDDNPGHYYSTNHHYTIKKNEVFLTNNECIDICKDMDYFNGVGEAFEYVASSSDWKEKSKEITEADFIFIKEIKYLLYLINQKKLKEKVHVFDESYNKLVELLSNNEHIILPILEEKSLLDYFTFDEVIHDFDSIISISKIENISKLPHFQKYFDIFIKNKEEVETFYYSGEILHENVDNMIELTENRILELYKK